MDRKQAPKRKKDDKNNLLSEIGLFVVEFEKLQKAVREFIVSCFEKEELSDLNLIHILLYKAQAMELTEYFRGIALYQLSKIETIYRSDEDKNKVKEIKKLISVANENLAEAATFRNDLLHASYDDTTEFYLEDKKIKMLKRFQGQRSKIRSRGIEFNHINIEPKVFEKVSDMMMILRFLIGHIGSFINDETFFKTANIGKDHLKVYSDIQIKGERDKLFKTTSGYYLNQFTYNRDKKAREEYYEGVRKGIIPAGG